MTMRTVQIYGSVTKDGNPSTGTITATLNGNTVYSGVVPSNVGSGMLFTFEVDMALNGAIPMVLTIQNCDVYMGGILANYYNYGESYPYTVPPTYNSSGPVVFLSTAADVDSRSNVNCTGAAYCSPPPPDPRPEGATGTWGWTVQTNGDTPAIFSYDLNILAGSE